MSKSNFKQLKLTSGEEIVCDYLQEDDEQGIAVIRAAMKIVEMENVEEGYSYFAFRPFMSFTEDTEKLQVIQISHIICETKPSKNLLSHYATTLTKMDKFLSHGKTMEELEMLDDDEFDAMMEEAEAVSDTHEQDERGPNVIKLKPKTDTFH